MIDELICGASYSSKERTPESVFFCNNSTQEPENCCAMMIADGWICARISDQITGYYAYVPIIQVDANAWIVIKKDIEDSRIVNP